MSSPEANNKLEQQASKRLLVVTNIEQLAELLTQVGVELEGEQGLSVSPKLIAYMRHNHVEKPKYIQFEIPKKSGAMRVINAPQPVLKKIQRYLNLLLQEVYDQTPYAMGFVLGRSVVDNAKRHMQQAYVYNIDLEHFFPSVTEGRIFSRLRVAPFGFDGDRKDIASALAGLCCMVGIDGRSVLPQGAPTSPTLTNFVCQRLDRRLAGLSKRFGVCYTRYADDMTFSAQYNPFKPNGEFVRELERIVANENFTINRSKVRLQGPGYRQEVTGLVVNGKVNVTKAYVAQLRMWLYYWERYGEREANAFLVARTQGDTANKKRLRLRDVLRGKLLYMGMVKGFDDRTYEGLRKRLALLSGIKLPNSGAKEELRQEQNELASLLEKLEQEGLGVMGTL